MVRLAPVAITFAVSALLLGACAGDPGDSADVGAETPAAVAPLTAEEQLAAAVAESCNLPPQDVEAGQPPEILCVYPNDEIYVLCPGADRRVPLIFKWATAGADRVWFSYDRVDDAEATSFTGPLDANGTYSGDPEGSLRHDCRPIFTDYTLTAEGEGGRSTVQFSLLTRIP